MAVEAPPRVRPRSGGRGRLVIVGLVIAGAIGFLLWQGLGNATVYFKTADEAVRDKESLGGRRFRVEGVVRDDVAQSGDAVRFTIEENGATVPVRHRGDPPELFRPGIPVVLEGHWQGAAFASDRIMVKHTSEYRAENPERVEDYTSTTR
ncbi:MAG: cytochrome c-type biosis protein CcmE [Actinomycetota bacterium]|jgi:cytochrome c-type biogenesis protein CcmE